MLVDKSQIDGLFYRALQEKFRGPRELIKLRLRVYLPFVLPLLDHLAPTRIVDLGCGRGEWLELVREFGFDAQGVDIDDGMLEACRELGLTVHTGDALSFLRDLPDASQSVVSGFHIVEHVAFGSVQELVREVKRVLKPGGLLLLETPNPENLIVGTSSFYLDPTHQRPIPPQLLAFIPEYTGFKRTTVVRLQGSEELLKRTAPTLLDVLNGVSPDYAVVAQKDGPEELLAATTSAFSAEYGLTLDALANKFQKHAEAKAQQAEAKAQQAEAKAQQAEAALIERFAQLQAVYVSSSWRITRPLRGIKRLLNGDFAVFGKLAAAAKLKTKQILRPAVVAAVGHVNARPHLRDRLNGLVLHTPWLRQRLVRVALNSHRNSQDALAGQRVVPLELQDMTPSARQIYQDLKMSMRDKNKGAF